MSAPGELTPELVEQRLSQLAELCELGDALLAVEMPPLSRATFERRALAIEGRVSDAAMSRLPRSVRARTQDPRDLALWTSVAGARHDLGWMPDVIVDAQSGSVLDRVTMVLVAVTRQLNEAVDAVEPGWKAIVTLRVLGNRPASFNELPVLQGWDGQARLWVGSARDRDRTEF